MKNLRTVTTRDEIHSFVNGLWKTEAFRASHRDGFIHEVIDQFAWLPRLFAEASNDQLERSHFSTWWNVIMLRDDYSNPFIHDLYLLHEIYHASYMPYVHDIGMKAFVEKMQRNELEASVFSEIQVYFEMPELRSVSFSHPIYADRFLRDPIMRNLWKHNRRVAIETLRTVRRDVMVSKSEHLLDTTERWVRRFARQNDVYASVWADRYLEVEGRMADFQLQAGFDRTAAIIEHAAWLEAEAGRDAVDNIPFRQEAELFAPHYWANKAKYAADMETEAKKAA